MVWTLNQVITTSFTKASGTTHVLGSSITAQVGDTIIVGTVIDNTGTGTPAVTSITKPGGETASWVKRGGSPGPVNTAGGGMISELWEIVTTVAWSAFTPTITWAASAANKGANGLRVAGLGAFVGASNHQAAAGTGSASTVTATPPLGGANPNLVVALLASEGALSVPGATGFTSRTGAWSTGGSVATNLGINMATAPGTGSTMGGQSDSSTADHSVVLAHWLAADAVISQAAYQFYADGTESGSVALAAQNTAPSVDLTAGDVPIQLRVRLQEGNGGAVPATDDFALQWEKNASGSWANISAVGSATVDDESTSGAERGWLSDTDTEDASAQSFISDGGQLGSAEFKVAKYGDPPGSVTARLYAHTGTFGSSGVVGAQLALSTSISAATLPTTHDWRTFTFSTPYQLVPGTAYFIALYYASGDTANDVEYLHDATNPHAGQRMGRDSSSSVWGNAGSENEDMAFRVNILPFTGPAIPHDSPSLDNTAVTTNRLGAGTGSFVAGDIAEDGSCDDFGWTKGNYTELLYGFKLVAAQVANGDTLRFRVLRNGVVLNTYAVVPTLTVSKVTGPVTWQASGTTPIVSGASGDATRVPLTFQASGQTNIVSGAQGNATKVAAQVSGTTAIVSGAQGAATLKAAASGTTPIVSGAQGDIKASHQASGTTASSSTSQGDVTARHVVAATTPIVSAASGDATVIVGGVTHQASGTTAIVSAATGDVTRSAQQASGTTPIVSGASALTSAQHVVSGTTPIVAGAQGTIVAALKASATTPIVSGASALTSKQTPASGLNAIVSGAQGDVTARHPVSGQTDIVSGAQGTVLVPGASGVSQIVSGASGDVTARHQASGTTAIVSGAQGTVGAGNAASGQTNIVSGAQGAATSQQPAGGTNPIVSGASGDVTARHQVSGTTAIVSGASGAVLGLGSSGRTDIVSGASGDVTARHQASGTTAIVSGAQGDVTKRMQLSGTTPILSAAEGAVLARHPVSGTTPIVSAAEGSINARVGVSGTTPIVSGSSGSATPVGSTGGTTAIQSGASGSPTSVLRASGTTAIVSGASGDVGAGRAVSATTPIVSAAQGAVTSAIRASGQTNIVSGAQGTITARHPAAGVTEILFTSSGKVVSFLTASGTTVIVSAAYGNVVVIGQPGAGGFPNPPIELTPGGPVLTLDGVSISLELTGAGPVLTLVGVIHPIELTGASEDLTLEVLT